MIETKNTEESDIPLLIKTIREKDKLEGLRLGFDLETNLKSAYCFSVYCKTFLIDGEVAAISGVAGHLFGILGCPFLLTNTLVYKISPIKFARIYMYELEQMKKLFPKLENYVDASYEEAVRLLKIAGFTLSGPELKGPDKSPFYKFTMDCF